MNQRDSFIRKFVLHLTGMTFSAELLVISLLTVRLFSGGNSVRTVAYQQSDTKNRMKNTGCLLPILKKAGETVVSCFQQICLLTSLYKL